MKKAILILTLLISALQIQAQNMTGLLEFNTHDTIVLPFNPNKTFRMPGDYSFQDNPDTIDVIMLMSDTSARARNHSHPVMYSTSEQTIRARREKNYVWWDHGKAIVDIWHKTKYLDTKCRPLPDHIVVWQSFESK